MPSSPPLRTILFSTALVALSGCEPISSDLLNSSSDDPPSPGDQGGADTETPPLLDPGGPGGALRGAGFMDGAGDQIIRAASGQGTDSPVTIGSSRGGALTWGTTPPWSAPADWNLSATNMTLSRNNYWVSGFSQSAADGMVLGHGLTVDEWQNVYVVGTSSGSVDFGLGPLAAGGFFFSYLFDRHPIQSWNVGTPATQVAPRVVELGPFGGEKIIAGSFSGAVDLGNGLIDAGHEPDAFVGVFTPEGVWKRGWLLGGEAGEAEVTALAVTLNANMLVGGWYRGEVLIKEGHFLPASTQKRPFLASISMTGFPRWWKVFEGVTGTVGALKALGDGVIITGDFEGTLTWGEQTLEVGAGKGVALLEVESFGGAPRWGRLLKGASLPTLVQAREKIVLAAVCDTNADLGRGRIVSATPGVCVARYDATGQALWTRWFQVEGDITQPFITLREGETPEQDSIHLVISTNGWVHTETFPPFKPDGYGAMVLHLDP